MSCPLGAKHKVIRGTKMLNTRKNLFYKNVALPVGENFCMEWIGAKREGYGRFRVGNKHVSAHRFSYEMFIREIPSHLNCLHTCDNRACVRPDHLFLGTIAENNQDRMKKGRHYTLRGEENGKAKLTEKDVITIKIKLKMGYSGIKLAKLYKVSNDAICKINTGKNWRHISCN